MSDREVTAPRTNPDLVREPTVDAYPAPVFERLHALTRKGYVADLGASDDTDLVVLRHSGHAPDLILHGDGVIEGFDGRRPFYKRGIEPPARIGIDSSNDHLRFMYFLDSVPRPSLRDRTRRLRHRYVYLPAMLVALWLGCLFLTTLLLSGL